MKRVDLLRLLTSALDSEDVFFKLAGPLAGYPVAVYNIIDPSQGNAEATSFGAETETYRVQLAVYDDQGDGLRQLNLLSELEGDLLEGLRGQEGIIRVRYAGGTGPSYRGSEREWVVTSDYRVTTGRVETATEGS